MGAGTGLLLWVVLTAMTLYALFFVIRAGVAAGIRQALPDSVLRPAEPEPHEGLGRDPNGAQV